MTARTWDDSDLVDIHARREAGQTWQQIADEIGIHPDRAKEGYSRARRSGRLAIALGSDTAVQSPYNGATRDPVTVWAGDGLDGPTVVGVTADERPDPEEVWARAEAEWTRASEKRDRQRSQEVRFARGPACLCFMSDLHLGGSGVNYPRIRREVEIIRDIPNSGVILLGDMVDNFIVRKLAEARYETRLTLSDEWVMAEHIMSLLGPRLVANISGNHEEWSHRLGGFDVLRHLTARVRRGVIYDTDEATVAWCVGDRTKRIRMRHKWLGQSIHNAIHGQGRAARWENDADIYVGAHTHRGALYGTLNVGDRLVMGVQLGAYKEIDGYQRREGFHSGAPDASIALVLHEDGSLTAYDRLDTARRVMEALV